MSPPRSSPLIPTLLLLPLYSLLLLLLLPAEATDASLSIGGDPCPARSDGSGLRSCPISCFRTDPVCGEDGVTYWCGCPDAVCAGVHVAKRGICEVGSGGTGLVAGQAFLLLHIVYLIIVGFTVTFGFL